MKRLIFTLLAILISSLIFSQNYVISIESTKKNKEAQLIKVLDSNEFEPVYVGQEIEEDDTLKTMFYTKATVVFDGLIIDIAPMSQIVVKYAYLKEKKFKAIYELKNGRVHVSFNSSKYDDKLLSIYIPYNKSTVTAVGTEFDVDSKGYVKVTNGTVRITKDKRGSSELKVKMLGPGDFGSISSEIVNRDKPPAFEPNEHRDRRPAPKPKDREPKGPAREPVNSPDNKAPAPKENRK